MRERRKYESKLYEWRNVQLQGVNLAKGANPPWVWHSPRCGRETPMEVSPIFPSRIKIKMKKK